MQFFWTFNPQIIVKNMVSKKMVSKKILSSTTVFNIDTNNPVSWAANHHIRMISGGSCDTEDWSNPSITGINDILKQIQIENRYFKLY